jgi:phospholipase/carboxylesterase
MASRLALAEPQLLSALVSLSGVPPMAAPLTLAPPEARERLPVFAAHGTHDPLLPIEAGRLTRDQLAAAFPKLTYREYPMGHMITPAEVADLRSWLAALA